MIGAIVGIGSLLMRIWTVIRGAKILSFIFIKGLLLSFSLYILPRVITMGMLKFRETLLPIFLDKIEPYLTSVTGQNISLQLSDFGAWVALEMDLVDTVSILISGCFTYLAIKLFMSK